MMGRNKNLSVTGVNGKWSMHHMSMKNGIFNSYILTCFNQPEDAVYSLIVSFYMADFYHYCS